MTDPRFDIKGVLGEGSLGQVLLARDRQTDRDVALKVLAETLVRSREARLALRVDYLALERLRHERTANAYEYGELPGAQPFYAMEVVAGPTLAELGAIAPDRARDLLAAALEGLAHLHSKNTLHGHLEPAKLRLTADGSLKLLGFGLPGSLGSRSDAFRGSAAYASPESARGDRLDARSDLYALGAVFYHLLASRPPFESTQTHDLLRAHAFTPPAPISSLRPDLPADLADLVMRLLAKPPADRPPSAGAVLGLLGKQAQTAGPLLVPPLVGREGPLAALAAALAEADEAADDGLVFAWLAGGPGSGKTRLLEALRLQAQASGHPVVLMDAREGARVPFGTLAAVQRRLAQYVPSDSATAIEGLAGELGALEPRAAHLRSIGAWSDLFAKGARHLPDGLLVSPGPAPRRLVLLMDNADEADEASMELLRALMRRRAVPVFAVGSMTGALPDGERGVAVDALGPAAVAEMAAGLLGVAQLPPELAKALHARSGGVPLRARAVLEVAWRDGQIAIAPDGAPVFDVETLPANDVEIGQRRLAHLPYPAWQLAEALTIMLGPERFARLGQWIGSSEIAIAKAAEALLAERLLTITPAGGRLADPFVTAALLADLQPERRAELHSRIAAGLESLDLGDETAIALTEHLAGAGDGIRAATMSIRGAGYCLRRLCFREVDRLLGLGEAGVRPGTAEQVAIFWLRGDHARLTGRFERAYTAYEKALADFPRMANRPDIWGNLPPPTGARILLSMAACRQASSRLGEAAKLAGRAAHDATVERDLADLARARMMLARLLFLQGHHAEAFEAAHEALAATRKAGDRQAEAEVLTIAGQIGVADPQRAPEAIERLEGARALREALGDLAGLADSDMVLGAAYLGVGSYAKAVAAVERSVTRGRELGLAREDDAMGLLVAATAACELGNFGAALALAFDARERAGGERTLEATCLALQARICTAIGRMADARDAAARALGAASADGSADLELTVRYLVAPVAVALGTPGEVHEAAKIGAVLAEAQNRPETALALHTAAVEAALAQDDGFRALEAINSATELAKTATHRGILARFQLAAARQQLVRTQHDAARAHLAEAQTLATASGMAALLAEAAVVEGQLQAVSTTKSEAARTLNAALDKAIELGMPLLAGQAAHALAGIDDGLVALRRLGEARDAVREIADRLPADARDDFCRVHLPATEGLPPIPAGAAAARPDRALAEFSRAVAAVYGDRAASERILEKLLTAMEADRGMLGVLDPDGGAPARVVRPADADAAAAVVRMAEPFVSRCLAGRRALRDADVPTPHGPGSPPSLLGRDLRTVLAVPLLEGETALGTLYLDRRSIAGAFGDADLRLAEHLGAVAAMALVTARRRAEAGDWERLAEAWRACGDLARVRPERPDLELAILRQAIGAARADLGTLYVPGGHAAPGDGRALHAACCEDSEGRTLSPALSLDVIERVVAMGGPAALASEPHLDGAARHAAILPMIAGRVTVGALHLARESARPAFSPRELGRIAAIADFGALLLAQGAPGEDAGQTAGISRDLAPAG